MNPERRADEINNQRGGWQGSEGIHSINSPASGKARS